MSVYTEIKLDFAKKPFEKLDSFHPLILTESY